MIKNKIPNLITLLCYIVQLIIFMVFAKANKSLFVGVICIEMIALLCYSLFIENKKLFIVLSIVNVFCLMFNVIMTIIYFPDSDKRIPVYVFIICLITSISLIITIILSILKKKIK